MAEWTPPVALHPSTGAKVARFPVIASDASSLVVMGNDIMRFDGGPVPARPLTVLSREHGDLGSPEGDFTFAYPRGVLRGGDLHMLWGEPDPDARTSDGYAWPGRLTSVWSATYSRSSGWTRPTQAYAGLLMAAWHSSASVGTSAAAPMLDFGVSRRGDTAVVVSFPHGDDPLTPMLIPIGSGGVYPSVARTRRAIVAAFAAGIADGTDNENSVFVVRSLDGGKGWSSPALVSRHGRQGAHSVALLVDAADQLHLVWHRDLGDSLSELRHAMSPDDGRSWVSGGGLQVRGTARSLRAAIDPCGSVHYHYVVHDSGRGRFEAARWRGGWSGPTPLFPGWQIATHAIHRMLDGSLSLVVLGHEDRFAETKEPLRMMHSRLERMP